MSMIAPATSPRTPTCGPSAQPPMTYGQVSPTRTPPSNSPATPVRSQTGTRFGMTARASTATVTAKTMKLGGLASPHESRYVPIPLAPITLLDHGRRKLTAATPEPAAISHPATVVGVSNGRAASSGAEPALVASGLVGVGPG